MRALGPFLPEMKATVSGLFMALLRPVRVVPAAATWGADESPVSASYVHRGLLRRSHRSRGEYGVGITRIER